MTKARVNADNASADIQGVTAGTGLTGGGTSGTVTLTNDMATVIDAKGDLVVGTGADTYDNLAAGTNGDTLVADSSTSTGLRYTSNFAAGKNKIINGDFAINQRNFTNTTSTLTYGFDRWMAIQTGGSTYSAQAFTAGTAPVAGYESTNFARILTSGQSGTGVWSSITQRIEDVRTFAGQTITLSFWAKAASGTPKVSVFATQYFGTGGSPSGNVDAYWGQVTLSTSWARYSITVANPSLSGKTVGTTLNSSFLQFNFMVSAGSDYNGLTNSLGIQSNTFDFWGVQLEAGSVATAFQTATGTIQGELAACQRYYTRFSSVGNTAGGINGMFTYNNSSTSAYGFVPLPVSMRIAPTAVDFSNLRLLYPGVDNYNISAMTLAAESSINNGALTVTTTGLAANRVYYLYNQASTNGYLGFSAEL
jgi:hypothetical protein